MLGRCGLHGKFFSIKDPAHKKASFAILTDERYQAFLARPVLEAISRHVPWTRNVRDRRNDVLPGRTSTWSNSFEPSEHRFVLNQTTNTAARAFTFGWESSESEWDDASRWLWRLASCSGTGGGRENRYSGFRTARQGWNR